MAWFKRNAPAPLTNTHASAPLTESDIRDVAAQVIRFVLPVYEHVCEGDEASVLVACTKMLQPWSAILGQASSIAEASLIVLDDKVAFIGWVLKDPSNIGVLNKEEIRYQLRKEPLSVVRAHFSKLDESVDFALAYITVAKIPLRYKPKNGRGLSRGMKLFEAYQTRLGAAGSSRQQ